jgi:hypothetical protein
MNHRFTPYPATTATLTAAGFFPWAPSPEAESSTEHITRYVCPDCLTALAHCPWNNPDTDQYRAFGLCRRCDQAIEVIPAPAQAGPSALTLAGQAIALLSPALAYQRPRGGATHRADFAAQQVEAGAVVAGPVKGLYLARSASQPGRVYEVNLEEQSCECTDWYYHNACWHLVGAALYEATLTRCPQRQCQQPMAPTFVDGDAAHICPICGAIAFDEPARQAQAAAFRHAYANKVAAD